MRDRTEVFADPFPHLTIEGLFPDDFYDELLANMPPVSSCHVADKNGPRDTVAASRLRFELRGTAIEQLPLRAQRVWRAAHQALVSEAFRAAIYTRLADGLSYRFGCRPDEVVERAPGFAVPAIFRERSGYSIAPHPDTRKKIVTMQIPLTPDDAQDGLGTDFYRRSFAPAAWLSEPRGFETAKSAPFRRNTASAFVVLNTVLKKSWHGKAALPPQQRLRDSILQIWYSKASDGAGSGDEYATPARAAA
ncbi:MAG: hypothetical protein ACRCT8_13700 [Lacipirellulaceae bacterium]